MRPIWFCGAIMNVEDIKNFTLTLNGARYDYPFENDFATFVMRHAASKKWFGIYLSAPVKSLLKDCIGEKRDALFHMLSGKDSIVVLNLKCDPFLAAVLSLNYRGVLPAYHMNKKHWISVLPDADIDDEHIKQLIVLSYDITAANRDKRSD